MKRKEIKWRREGRRVMTGRQDGVIFRIWTPYDAPEKGYYVDSHDTKGKGRSIKTADRKAFPTWEAAVEFCQQIMVGEVDLETMRLDSAYNRPLAYRYRHTEKKRTRKKYAKRILAWYREEVL